MNDTARSSMMWATFGIITVTCVALGGLGYFLFDQFGKWGPVVLIISLFGGVMMLLGQLMSLSSQRSTANTVGQIVHSVMDATKSQNTVAREYAKAERVSLEQQAKLITIDAKRVDDLAKERAKALQAPTQIEVPQVQPQAVDAWDDAEFIEIS